MQEFKVSLAVPKSPISIKIGRLVRELRGIAGVSQEELADRCGIHRTYLGSIERGEKSITVETAKKLCDGLGMKLSEFFIRLDKFR